MKMTMKRVETGFVAGLVSLLALAAPSVHAATLAGDLTTAGSTATVNSAIYNWTNFNSTGSGVIDSFVRLGTNDDVEQGYNTTVNNTFDNTSDDTHNHAVALSLTAPPIVDISGTFYRELLLDIDEPNDVDKRLLSLDEVQILLSSIPNQSVETFTAGGIVNLASSALVYRLDTASIDNYIALNGALNTGNGSGDVFVNVPNSLFTAVTTANPTYAYLYVYSRFGEQVDLVNDGGFEEWAYRLGVQPPPPPPPPVIPEPASLLLMGSGLLGTLGAGASRHGRRRSPK